MKSRMRMLLVAFLPILVGLGLFRPHLVKQSISSAPAKSSKTVHEKFATFLNGDGFYATLLLENVRPDLPMQVQVSLILESGQVPMQTLTLAAHSSQTIDISAFLQAHGYSDTRGTVCVRFSFSTYGPLIAAAQSYDTVHHIYMNSFAQSAEEYWAGTAYDGVIWAPDEGAKGFVSIMNTSFETKDVHVNFLADGHSQALPAITVGPRQTYFLPIDDLVARSRNSGAGIHIQYDEYPGDIVVEGQLYNERTGFAKNIHFADEALEYPTATLRAHFALLGEQPPEDGYPAGLSFRSVAAVRNVDTVPLTVTPNLKFLQNGTVQTISLQALHLGVGESQIIDLSKAQESGSIPNDVHRATVELVPANNKGSIVAELFSFDATTGGYVVGSPFTSYPNHSTSSIWRTDGTFQTEMTVENTSDQNDVVVLKAFAQNGQSYVKSFPIAAGGLLDISLRQLQQDQVPDDSGRLLTDTSGIIQLVGSLNAQSKLSFDKIIHSDDEADYVGLPAQPCDYVESIDMFLNGPGFGNDIPIMEEWDWAQAGAEDQVAGGVSSSNTSIAQISVNSSTGGDVVTFTWPKGGTASVALSVAGDEIDATDCDACSGGPIPVEPDTVPPPPMVTFVPSSVNLAVGQTTTLTAEVDPSDNTTPISLDISGPIEIESSTEAFVATESVTVKGISAGSAMLTANAEGSEGGSIQVGSATISVYTPVPTSLQIISGTNSQTTGSCTTAKGSAGCGSNRSFVYQILDQNGNPFQQSVTFWDSFGTPSPNPLLMSSFATTCGNNSGPCGKMTTSSGQFTEASLSVCSTVCYNPSTKMCVAGGPSVVAQTWHIGSAAITQTISFYCNHVLVNGQ